MYSHMMVGSDDIARSKTFYDAIFAEMGAKPGFEDPRGRLIYSHNGAMFLVTPPINGEPASHGNGSTIGFAMTPEQADAWHAAGVANGGTAIEDPPGVREGGGMKLYLAYLRDPDGNKLCALHNLNKNR
jgi:catechol 2,3-dioxygenase-like lactoylglutathione lyase family enzyme